MKLKFVSLLVALLATSNATIATERPTITVFNIDRAPVLDDRRGASQNFDIMVYNMDIKERWSKEITAEVKVIAESYPSGKIEERYQNGFMEVMNSDRWSYYSGLLKEAAFGIDKAVRFRLKKLPAIVFDKKYIVYGETSLANAIDIYLSKGRDDA